MGNLKKDLSFGKKEEEEKKNQGGKLFSSTQLEGEKNVSISVGIAKYIICIQEKKTPS